MYRIFIQHVIMKNKTKRLFIKIVLGVYIITTFLQPWIYTGNTVYAASSWNNEPQRDYTNIVAILVNDKIYNKIEDDVKWYATEYIQWKSSKKYNSISNSKALVFPINADNFSTKNIAQLLENMYFDWIDWETSRLIWLVLIWDIPLPVVNQDWYIYPTIYPYVDFEEQKFIWDEESKYFVYNNNPNWQAEIWHWMINFEDNIKDYEDYFDKLRRYWVDPDSYIWKAIWYEDFIWNNKYFNSDSLNFYLNNYIFAEDLWYHRYSDLLIKVLQGQRNSEIAELMEWLNEVNSWGVDLSGMDTLSELNDDMNTPTMQIKAMLDKWYLSNYSSLFGQKYLKTITNNVETANRWIESRTWAGGGALYLNAFDSVYKKAEVTDEVLLRRDSYLEPFLIMVNNALEEAVDTKVEQEKYWLNEVIPLTYLNYLWLSKWNKCVWWRYDAYENYFFWKNAKYIESMEETTTFRWTFRTWQVLWAIDWMTIQDIQNGLVPSTDLNIDLNKKSIWWSYEIFAQQVDANRWYNYNNAVEEFEIYSGNKTAKMENWWVTCTYRLFWICWKRRWDISHKDWSGCDLSEDWDQWWCESPTDYALRIWWWASPLNLEINWTNYLRKSGYFYTWATSSIFDIAWSTIVKSPERNANSYKSVSKYSTLLLRKFSPSTNKKKYKAGNPMKKDPAPTWMWYDYSMDYDVKFTNKVPEFDPEDDTIIWYWKDVNPKKASSVDYFNNYNSSARKEWDIIKIERSNEWGDASCHWAWEIYTYRTLDSRVKNDSVNKEEIDGVEYRVFYDDVSPVKQFYDKLDATLDSISESVDRVVWSDTGSLNNTLLKIKTDIKSINSGINYILDLELTWWEDTWFIETQAEIWSWVFNASKAEQLLNDINDAQDGVEALSWFVNIWEWLFDGVIDYIEEQKNLFKINWDDLILLNRQKILLDVKVKSIVSRFQNIKSTITDGRDNYHDIAELKIKYSYNDTIVEKLLDKKSEMSGFLEWTWCYTTYKPLCDILTNIIYNYWRYAQQINEEKDGINNFKVQEYDNDWNIKTWDYETIHNIFEHLVASSIFTNIDANPMILWVSSVINTIPTTHNEELTWYIPWMNMTTSDRPIDSPRYLTFKWIWWDKVTFIYPDIYKAEIFSWNSNVLTLKSTWDIKKAIEKYLKDVVNQYNKYLRVQSGKYISIYNANSAAYDLLDSFDNLASPNHKWDDIRPYNLFDENYLINWLKDTIRNSYKSGLYFSGEELANSDPIWFIAEMIYYQNVAWQTKSISGTIQWDFDNQRQDFDINEKISYLMDNYLVKDNDKWSFLTPDYRPDWYEVAFINSDWGDRILYENTPDIVNTVSSASANYVLPATIYDEALSLEQELLTECNIPMDWWVLLFQLSGLSVTSPWWDALKCWREKIKEKPLELSVTFPFTYDTSSSFLDNLWDIFNRDDYQNIWETYQNYANQWRLLDMDDVNDTMLDNLASSNPGDMSKLHDILSYTLINPKKSIISADNPKWEIDITSSKQLWEVEFSVVNVWASKIKLFDGNTVISNNITAWTWWFSTWILRFDPYNQKTLSFQIDNPKEGLNVVVFSLCLPWTENCVRNSFRLDVVPWEVKNVKIELDKHIVLEWASVPFKLKWTDRYGNEIWELISQKFETFVNSWLLMLKWVKAQSIKISNFNKTNFSLIATGWNLDWKKIAIQVSWSIDWVPWVKATWFVDVIKWRLDTYSGSMKIASWKDVNAWLLIQLPDKNIYYTMNQPNSWTMPYLKFKLVDKNGNLIDIDWKISVRTKNNRLSPWNIVQKNEWNKFSKAKTFDLSGWTCTVYLSPNFSAWEDVIYISMEWVDDVQIPVTIKHASPKVLWLSADNVLLNPNSSTKATLKVFDNWKNIIDDENVSVVLWSVNDKLTLSKFGDIEIKTGSYDFDVFSVKWWLWYVYAYFKTIPLGQQSPDTLKVTIQETMLPEKDLNVMYLNLFGNDRGNQWWYMSDNEKYSESLINNSDKLLTITTQLLDLENIKYYPIIIDSGLQINNVIWNDITFRLYSWFLFDVDKVWTISVNSSSFNLGEARISEDMLEQYITSMVTTWAYNNKNVLVYIPEQTDSIIESNDVVGKSIYINWEKVFEIGTNVFDKNITISLWNERIAWYQVWEMFYDTTLIGRILFIVNKKIGISINMNSKSSEYWVGSTWINWSSNEYWLWFYELDSSLPKKSFWYKSIQDSYNAMLWIWFTADFKNITNFGWWMPVWEATLPFGSELLINIWDPLLKRIDGNESAKVYDNSGNVVKDTQFDLWLWDVIYSDPNKEIFKVLDIDFNNDKLKDIIVIYKDWTVNMLKNYGGTDPYQNLWALMTLADRISDVSAWDVDGNGYEDLLIWTQGWVLRVYLNHNWIFDVDGYPVCINVNVNKWEISEHPERISGIHQIFLKDMDLDKALDIVTNDELGFVKIFYGWTWADWSVNYVSTNKYMCDENWYTRVKNNSKMVYQFGIKIDNTAHVLDQSLIRWKWISNTGAMSDISPDALWISGDMVESLSGVEDIPTDLLADTLSNLVNVDMSAAEGIYQQVERFKKAWFGVIPVYEPSIENESDLDYVEIWALTSSDPVKVYKVYEDMNNNPIESNLVDTEWALVKWDIVKVTVYIEANQKFVWTFIDKISWPWIIPLSEYDDSTFENFWFDSSYISSWYITSWQITNITRNIHWDLDNARYMIDNINMNKWNKLKFSYGLIYNEYNSFDIDIDILSWSNFSGLVYPTKNLDRFSNDVYPDISVQPTDWCNDSMFVFFNNWSGTRDYEYNFMDLGRIMAEYNAGAQDNYSWATNSVTQDLWNSIVGWDAQQVYSSISDMAGGLWETMDWQWILSSQWINMSNLSDIWTQLIDALTANAVSKIDDTIWSLCNGISLWSLGLDWSNGCWLPVPFNRAFLWVWKYKLFGCYDVPFLSETIWKWIPILNIPTTYWIYPWIWFLWLPTRVEGVDSYFLWAPSWTYPSMFRLYVMPTLTAKLWFALCFGPQTIWDNIPDPFASIVWNCVVFAVDLCGKKSWNWNEWPNSTSEIPYEYTLLRWCSRQNNPTNLFPWESSSPFVFWWSSSTSNKFQPVVPWWSYAGWFINIEVSPDTAFQYQESSPLDIDEIILEWWALVQNAIRWSKEQWLIQKIVKQWLDKQIKYIMTQLTNFKISVVWPDLEWVIWKAPSPTSSNVQKQDPEEMKKDCEKNKWQWVEGDEAKKKCNWNAYCCKETEAEQKLKCENRWKQRDSTNKKCVKKISQNFEDEALNSIDSRTQQNLLSREQISSRSEYTNPFKQLEDAFSETPLINISTQDITVNVPMITSEDITSYISMSQSWVDRQMEILEDWQFFFESVIGICGGSTNINWIDDLWNAISELKEQYKEANSFSQWSDKDGEIIWKLQWKINALEKLKTTYNLSDLWDYKIYEAKDWGFYVYVKYSDINSITPKDVYLYFDPNSSNLSMFTSWFDLVVSNVSNNNTWKTKISIKRNNQPISNDWLAIKQDTETINHSCAEIFLDWTIDSALNWFLNIQSSANSMMFSVKENMEILQQYKLFPLQLYDWIHVEEKYLWEVSNLVNSVLGTLSLWMETNANRYSQYIDAIITIMATLETYQLIIDLSADWTESCSTCTNDNYNQFSCKLGKICDWLDIELPVIEIPSTKIPSIYLDFSEIHVSMDVKLPNFVFNTVAIPLPELPNIPSPPNLDMSVNLDDLNVGGSIGAWLDFVISQIKWVDFNKFSSMNLWSIPLLPSPPTLPELPSLMPEIQMELPLLPPAPKIPALPDKITWAVKAAKIIWKILCIVKWKFWLVAENSIKAKVEQITERDYEIPYWDNNDLTFSDWNLNVAATMPDALASVFTWFAMFLQTDQFKKVKLKWFDLSLQTYVNLQFNFDYLYSFLDSVVDEINGFSYNFITSNINDGISYVSNMSKEFADKLQACSNNPISVECNPESAELIEEFKQLEQSVNKYKAQLEGSFDEIWTVLTQIETKTNRIEELRANVDKLAVELDKNRETLHEYKDRLNVTYNDADKEILRDKIKYYTTIVDGIQEEIDKCNAEISKLEQEILDLNSKYGEAILEYDRLKNFYENLLWRFSSLKDNLMQQSSDIIGEVNDQIKEAWENIDFEKLNQVNQSINSWQTEVDNKKQQDKQRRSENLQDLYKEIDGVVSYVDYDPSVNDNNINILKETLQEISNQTNNKDIKNRSQESLSLITMNKKINANTDSIDGIQSTYNSIVNDYKNHNEEFVNLIEEDYDQFLVALSDNKISLVNSNKPFDITLSANLFDMDKDAVKALSSQESLVKKYLDYNVNNLQWYLNALENYDAKTLNMSDKEYNLSKSYLKNIKQLSDKVYDIIDNEWDVNKWVNTPVLLAQSAWWSNWWSNNSSSVSSTIDIANYIDWYSINTEEGSFLLANKDYINKFQSRFLLTDINWDGSSDLILWDKHNIYIKYRNDNSTYVDTEYYKKHNTYAYYNTYYSYKLKSYDDLVSDAKNWFVKIGNMWVKLIDSNWEVKNFKYAWQTFDTIKVSWSNSSVVWDKVDWYLVKMIHRVDQFNDSENLINQWNNEELFHKKYILVLPKWSEVTGTKLKLEKETLSNTERWIWTWNIIFSLLYYNDWDKTINLTVSDLPRNWQYSEIYTLTFEENTYKISSSSSNQVVAWPQIIADTEWPDPDVKMYRPSTDTIVSEWTTLQWYVWTNYILQVDWEDNVAMDEMWIFDEYGETLALKQNVNNKTGYIELSGLYFTWEQSLRYYILWVDIDGNRYSTDVTLRIKTPSIEITKILQWTQNLTFTNWIVSVPNWIWNISNWIASYSTRIIWNDDVSTIWSTDSVVTVVAELEHDIDSGFVQFFNNRASNRLEILTWTVGSQWLSVSSFKVGPWMDTVYWWNFSMGDEIWLYSVSGNMVATVNPNNWKITVAPGYQNNIKIKLDYSAKIPVIRVMDGNKVIFWIVFSGKDLVNVTTHSNHVSIQNLNNEAFGDFNGGKVVVRDWEALLYVSPKWQIYTEIPLYWEYSFDDSTQSVVYSFRTAPNGNNLWSVKIRIKNLLE